jgi:translation initiation factor 1
MAAGKKISTDGGQSLAQNPFAGVNPAELGILQTGYQPIPAPRRVRDGGGNPGSGLPGKAVAEADARSRKNRGRVDIRRETGNRGGKTVTVVDGFVGIGLPEKEQLAKKMRAACGCGGTVKDGAIEIQGDQREKIAAILSEAGFRPVMAGG